MYNVMSVLLEWTILNGAVWANNFDEVLWVNLFEWSIVSESSIVSEAFWMRNCEWSILNQALLMMHFGEVLWIDNFDETLWVNNFEWDIVS